MYIYKVIIILWQEIKSEVTDLKSELKNEREERIKLEVYNYAVEEML